MLKSRFLSLAFTLLLFGLGAFALFHVAGFMLRALIFLVLIAIFLRFLRKRDTP